MEQYDVMQAEYWPAFGEKFGDAYEDLYNGDYKLTGLYCDIFEKNFKQSPLFKSLVRSFVMWRGDCLTSDRECAAFAAALKHEMPFFK